MMLITDITMPEHEELECRCTRSQSVQELNHCLWLQASIPSVPSLMTKLFDAWEHPEHMLVNYSHRREDSKLPCACAHVGKLQVN